jgi:type I restriction enzyme, S subunit
VIDTCELEHIEIGKALKITSGFPFPSRYFSNEAGFPLIRIRDIQTSKIETYYNGPYVDTYVVNPGDILIGMDGDFHVVKWRNGSALLNQRILKIEVSDLGLLSLGYIYYWLGPYIMNINHKTAATTVKHLSIKDVQKASGLIPKKEIQRKIAAILETIDQAIERTEALIHKYQQIKAGLMHDLFTRGLTDDGKLRPPREKAPELNQETPIGWIPKGWDLLPLKKIATFQHGRSFPSSDYSDEGVLLLRPGNLHISGIVMFDEAHTTRIPNKWLQECPSFVLKNERYCNELNSSIVRRSVSWKSMSQCWRRAGHVKSAYSKVYCSGGRT